MEGNVGDSLLHHANQTHILNDDAVGTVVRGHARQARSLAQLTVTHQSIEGDINLCAADMAVAHCLFKFFFVKVCRTAPCIEAIEPQVYGIGSALYGGNDAFRRACRC